jgi:putative nucleotidyltransferase with HDIG domain
MSGRIAKTPAISLYLISLAGATLVLALIAVTSVNDPFPNLWAIAGLALVAAAFETNSVRLSGRTESSIALLPVVFAAVLFGPAGAMFVAAASLVTDFRRPYMKWAVHTLSRSITGGATGVATLSAASFAENPIAKIAIATVAGAVVAEVLDMTFAILMYRIRKIGPAADVVRLVAPLAMAAVPLYAPLVAVLALAYNELSAWTMPLFFGPALAAQQLFGLYREQRELAGDLREVNEQLERANLSFATALVATLDARDQYTAGHSAAVAVYARDIAARLGLDDDQQRLAHLCGLVHDIGKVGLPPGLLEKPGPLTLEERRQMETHAVIGERILRNVDDYSEIARIVRHHHERVDGHGYPDHLTGENIPLISRIISVADAYNAMTSDRPYREALPSRVARLRLAQAVDSQFDTGVVAAFEAILAGSHETYRAGHRMRPHVSGGRASSFVAAVG